MMKRFGTGHMSSVDNKMIIDFDGTRYIATFEKVDNKSEDIFHDIEKYLT